MKLRGLEEWCLLLGLIICLDSVTFGWCTKPIVDFEISPCCYDESDDKYYVGYKREINIDAYNPYNPYTLLSADPDCRECEQCDGISCSGEELLNGLQKFKWYFGDGTIEWETCSSQDDGDFDGETTHEYTSTGNKTVTVRVYDGDETCDYRCPDDWHDHDNIKSKSIAVVRGNLSISGLTEADEESPGYYIGQNNDDDNSNDTPDKDEDPVSGEGDLVGLSLGVSPSLSEGKVKLSRTSNKIKVWDSQTKNNLIIPDGTDNFKEWDAGSYPSTLWVEGFSGGVDELSLSYKRDGVTVHSDLIKFTVVQVSNLRFEEDGASKDWITACTLAGAHSYAVADITPSGLSITYQIVGTAHGAAMNSSTGKITHNGSDDGGTIQIKAYATSYTCACDGPEDFEIKAKPISITSTELKDPYTRFDSGYYGLCKKHTFASSTGNPSDLYDTKIFEKIHWTQNDFGALPPDLDPGEPEGNFCYLDASGKMATWDKHTSAKSTTNINDFWPSSFPAIISGTQKWYWYSEDGLDYVHISGEPTITHTGKLIKMNALSSGVIPFKWTMLNTSSNSSAQCSSDNADYIKNFFTTSPPQYYVGQALPLDESYNLNISAPPGTITPGSQLSVTMSGMAGATETETGSASRLITFLLIDDDLMDDDVLWTISNENIFSTANGGVPSGAAWKGSVIVPFSVTKANALNQERDGTVLGPDDDSGESIADIAFEIDVSGSNPQSPPSPVSASAYNLLAPDVDPNPVPSSSNATVTMTGCTEATVTSGTMNMSFHVIDDDSIIDDILVSNVAHSFTVPTGQILGGLVDFGSKNATITNDSGIIKGVDGSSGEGPVADPAEIAFEIVIDGGSNPQSAITSVTAN